MLGFFVSEDPLDGYGEVLRSESTHSITDLLEFGEDEEVNVIYLVYSPMFKKGFQEEEIHGFNLMFKT